MSWSPADDELDAAARTLAVPDRAADRVEQERTSVLAQAAGMRQLGRGSRAPVLAGATLAVAAAAAVAIWIVARPAAEPKEHITALGPAHFARVGAWPDFVVRVDDGRVGIRVSKLAPHERFRAVTSDAEIEVRGTQFEVGADHGHVRAVAVIEGRVEVRWQNEPPIFLSAGESWSPPRTAERDVIVPASPSASAPSVAGASPSSAAAGPTIASPPAPAPTTHHRAHDEIATSPHPLAPAVVAPMPAPAAAAPATPPVATASPGEADFRAGVAALRAGNPSAATRSFATACRAAEHEALGEDACFWLGAAAKRAGDTATARDALTRFLTTFPGSARAGEAAALLGWILYDAGELDAAETRFELAARDRVEKIKQSAQRGLEAIARKRSTP